jgi:PKD repeat protein
MAEADAIQQSLVARIIFPPGTAVGDGLYFELTNTLNAAPLTLSLQSSVVGGDSPYSYRWDFGDGSSPNSSANVVHVYQYPGYYILHLTVTDSGGNESIAWAGFSVYSGTAVAGTAPNTQYHFMISGEPNQGFAPLRVEYGVGGYGGPGSPMVVLRALDFHFGDGSPDATYSFPSGSFNWNASTSHTYSEPGEYLMSMNATESINGATAYDVSEMTVIALGPHSLPMVVPDQLSDCCNYNYTGSAESGGFFATFLGAPPNNITIWSPGDGTLPVVGNPALHTYTAPSSGFVEFNVQLLALFGTNLTLTSQHTMDLWAHQSASSSSSGSIFSPIVVTFFLGLVVGCVGVGAAMYLALRGPWSRSRRK